MPVLALPTCALAAASLASSRVRVDPESGRFVDGLGRVRIFHGVNAVYKEWPWLPTTDAFDVNDSLAELDMENLRSWGFNVVRLGVMWPGVEPTPGHIDEDYLQRAAELAARLGQYDIYTIVDFHQDLGSRRFCGEGIPEHYVDALLEDPLSRLSNAQPFPLPWTSHQMELNASGYPSTEDCHSQLFSLFYGSERVGALFHELYSAGTPLNDGVRRYWAAMAKAFAAEDHVVGYELLNEPPAFCLETNSQSCLNPEPLTGYHFEDTYLVPFYRGIAESIRAVDPKTPIFMATSPYPKVTGALPFSEPPLPNDTQQVLAYHVYCPPGPEGVVTDLTCSAMQAIFENSPMSFLRKFKSIAGFMTEFGAISQSPAEMKHVERILNNADAKWQSWAYWQLKSYRDLTTQNNAEPLYDEEGNLEVDKLRLLSRTYAQAIAGDPVRMHFSSVDGTFELEFQVSSARGATVIYANKAIHYPNGLDLEVTPPGCLESRWTDEHHLELTAVSGHRKPKACADKLRKVRITRTVVAEVDEATS